MHGLVHDIATLETLIAWNRGELEQFRRELRFSWISRGIIVAAFVFLAAWIITGGWR